MSFRSLRRLAVGRVLRVLALLGFGLCIGIVVGSALAFENPEYQEPLLYPTAEQVTVVEDDGLIQITTFHTRDTPEQVVNFYMDHLPEHGWRVMRWYPNGLEFSYRKRPYNHSTSRLATPSAPFSALTGSNCSIGCTTSFSISKPSPPLFDSSP